MQDDHFATDDSSTEESYLPPYCTAREVEVDEKVAAKAARKLLKAREAFFDLLWARSGDGCRMTMPQPGWFRQWILKARLADHADGCLLPKEFAYVLWAARVLKVKRSRDVLGGMCAIDGELAEFGFSRGCMPDNYMFDMVVAALPLHVIPRVLQMRGPSRGC